MPMAICTPSGHGSGTPYGSPARTTWCSGASGWASTGAGHPRAARIATTSVAMPTGMIICHHLAVQAQRHVIAAQGHRPAHNVR